MKFCVRGVVGAISLLFFSGILFAQGELMDSVINTIDKDLIDTAKIQRILYIAHAESKNNPDLSQQLAELALNQSQKLMFDRGIAGAHNSFGVLKLDRGEYQAAIGEFNIALSLYYRINNITGIVNTHNNIALVYSDLGDYSEAIYNYTRALKVLEDSGPSYIQSRVLINTNLAKLYMDLQIYSEAETFLNNTLEIIDNNNLYDCSKEHLYSMLSSVALNKGDSAGAMKFLNLSTECCKKSKNANLLSANYCGIGDIMLRYGDAVSAEKYYRLSLSKSVEMKNSVQIIRCLNSLAYLCYYTYRNDSSLIYADSAFNMSLRSGFLEGEKNALLYMGYVEYEQGKYKLAYEHNVQSHKILSDNSNIAAFTIADLLMKIEKERDLFQNKLLLQKKTVNTLVFVVIIITLLLASMIVIQVYKRRIRKIKISEDSLSKELTSKALYMAKNNESINRAVEILNDNKEKFIPENRSLIQSIINDMQNSQNPESWTEFEHYFTSVNKKFYTNLNRKFPNLTLNEKRLCALLSLNLTTKEISSITHQTMHAIDIARGRLRKKLDLAYTKTNLYDFLSGFN